MKSRLLSGLAVLLLLASMALPMAYATETEETTEATDETVEETTADSKKEYSTAKSGSCGKDATWQLEDHTLIITGSGAVDAGSPWEFYKDSIEVLVLNGEITSIGDSAFASCNNLRYIDFGSSLKEIGYQAFFSCNALEAIRLPASFRLFGPESFKDCDGLQLVYCEGPMPSFKGSCLYTNHTVQVLYSHATPWPWEEVERLMTNFGSRLHVDQGSEDALDVYFVNKPKVTIPETVSAAEETVPAETVPETTVPETTVPVTVPVTVAEETVPATTAAVTVPAETEAAATEEVVFALESEPLFVTEPEHVPHQNAEEPAQEEGFGGWVWVIIAAAALTGILILALVIRMIIHSVRRYED